MRRPPSAEVHPAEGRPAAAGSGRTRNTGGVAGNLERGREAWARRRWGDAVAALRAADGESALAVADLERLALAQYLIGDEAATAETWQRAHHDRMAAGDTAGAARCAFWLAFGLDITGTDARAAGWYERARRLVDDAGLDCVERGYVQVPGALAALMIDDDAAGADATFATLLDLGERFGDADLTTLARLGRGHALVLLGQRAAGVAMLDEVMVAVTAGEVIRCWRAWRTARSSRSAARPTTCDAPGRGPRR